MGSTDTSTDDQIASTPDPVAATASDPSRPVSPLDDAGDTSTETSMETSTDASAGTSSDPSMDASVSTDSKSSYSTKVPIPSGINPGLTFADQATMLAAFGTPGALSTDCSNLTNAKLQGLMKTANVGPFKATGFGPVIDCLTRVFSAVQAQQPDLYAVLTTAGVLCCRAVRGSKTQYSNHSWGTAIDISIGGVLTDRGATQIQQGLVALAPFMNAESMFWGAGFSPTPDAMHFEASHELIVAWQTDGTIPSA